jgi:hypothetical protein
LPFEIHKWGLDAAIDHSFGFMLQQSAKVSDFLTTFGASKKVIPNVIKITLRFLEI